VLLRIRVIKFGVNDGGGSGSLWLKLCLKSKYRGGYSEVYDR